MNAPRKVNLKIGIRDAMIIAGLWDSIKDNNLPPFIREALTHLVDEILNVLPLDEVLIERESALRALFEAVFKVRNTHPN